MTDELDANGEWQRLYELYHGMPDVELMELAETPEDLTELAQDVLRREMKARRLEVVREPEVAASPVRVQTEGIEGFKVIADFYDALQTRRVCTFLDEAELEFALEDFSVRQQGMHDSSDGPPVHLRLAVKAQDEQRVKALLRAKMGLFPLQEVAEPDDLVDDGTVATVGEFVTKDDAEACVKVLAAAGIWCSILDLSSEFGPEDNPFEVQVKEMDVFRAADVLEEADLAS